MKIQTEQEKYFARKNQRRQWWSDNWQNFFIVPLTGVFIAALLCGLAFIITDVGIKSIPVRDEVRAIVDARVGPALQQLDERLTHLQGMHYDDQDRLEKLETRVRDLEKRSVCAPPVTPAPQLNWLVTTNMYYTYTNLLVEVEAR